MEKENNAIIRTHDIDSATVDVVSCAYIAQEVILSYLTSLQEETFLGYNVSELVEVAEEIDPLECIRITPDGLVTLRIEEDTKASDLCKLLVGTGCVIVTAVTIAGSCVFVECPFLSGLSTAVAGIAIETLMQVVISEKPLDSVDWHKIAISAVVGAVSGWIGPYVLATTEANSFSYYVLDSAIDGLLGGIEQTVEAWMDGEDAARIISSFGMGSALGFALSAGFKGIAAGMSKMAQKLNTVTNRLAEKLPKTITDKARAIKLNAIDILKEMKERADSSLFHSEYISRKMAERQIGRLVSQNSDELMDKSINTLSADNIYDVQGVKINKDKLKSIAKDATDGATVAYFEYGDEFAEIIKKNSMVGVVFDQKYQTVIIPGGLTENRGVNFENVATLLKEQWIDTPDLIPKSIAEAIADIGQVEELMPRDLVRIIQSNKDWVIHENIDRISATLVPRNLHSDIKHMGGVGLAKYLKSHMGKEYFDRLVSVAATYTVIAVH